MQRDQATIFHSEGFASNRTRPMEFAGDQGNRRVTDKLVAIIEQFGIRTSTDAPS